MPNIGKERKLTIGRSAPKSPFLGLFSIIQAVCLEQPISGTRSLFRQSAWNRTISGSLHLVVDLYRIAPEQHSHFGWSVGATVWPEDSLGGSLGPGIWPLPWRLTGLGFVSAWLQQGSNHICIITSSWICCRVAPPRTVYSPLSLLLGVVAQPNLLAVGPLPKWCVPSLS